MKENLRAYLDNLFADAPQTRRVYELKEELYANLCDKYNDMMAQGRTEQESFDAAVRSIGDVNELLYRIRDDQVEPPESRQKTAKVVACSVGLYILSIIQLIVMNELGLSDMVTMTTFFVIAGGATCWLIYHFMSKPRYVKEDDTVVEEFKQWSYNNKRSNEVFKTLTSVLWLVTVALYFIITFTFGGWHFTWVIFILAAAVQNILKLFFDQGGKGKQS